MKTIAKKRILMILSNIFETDGRVTLEAETLLSNNFQIFLIEWDRGRKYPHIKRKLVNGVHIYSIKVKSKVGMGNQQLLRLPLFWFFCLKIGLTLKFDVIHCHDFDTLPIGWIIGKLKRKPIIFDSHEAYILGIKDRLFPPLVLVVRLLEKFFLKRIDYTLTVSGNLVNYFLNQVCAKRVVLVPNYRRLDDFNITENEINLMKTKLRIKDELVVVFVGIFAKYAMIFPLLEAINELVGVKLILAGGATEYKFEIEEKIKKTKNVAYLGWIPREKVPLIYLIGDVSYVCCDPTYPVFSFFGMTKFYNSLLGECAIISNDGWEMAKLTNGYKIGIVINDPEKNQIKMAIEKLKNDYYLLNSFKENAKWLGSKKYNWNISERNLLEVYNHLIC